MYKKITLDRYTLEEIKNIVHNKIKLQLSNEVKEKINTSANFVQKKIKEDIYIYGVNTGFGSLCETRIMDDEMEELQYRHVISHASGVGEIISEKLSRFTFFIKLLTLRHGYTGVSLELVEMMCKLWNMDIIPTIPKKGSVGASGDLAPLAHMALPLLGLGSVYYKGKILDTKQVFSEHNLKPLKLKPKEGLALTNGVQYINGNATDQLTTIGNLIKSADVLTALSAQAYSTSKTFYQPLYHTASYHKDRMNVALNLKKLLEGSNHFDLPTSNNSKQDPYSFRCSPQVHGAVRQTYNFTNKLMIDEVNGCSDNPLFFPEKDEVLFGGNLHGESSAFVLDFIAIALSELANISERRTYLLLSGTRGLPSFLTQNPGLNSGLMLAQYTSAALMNETKLLANPASTDTIPTCQLQEDHVSMGATSAYKLHEIINNSKYIFAIELFNACQAIELNIKNGLKISNLLKPIFKEYREKVKFLDNDRILADDINASYEYFNENFTKWPTIFKLI